MMDGFDFPVEVVKTDRKKSASIQLDGEVVKVRVPRTLSDRRIRELIARRTSWITAKLKEAAERPVVKPKEYVSGETFPCLGRNYRLKVTAGDEPSVRLRGGYLQATVRGTDERPRETVRLMLAAWYRERAEKRLGEKTERFAKVVGVEPRSVAVKDYKSRWGSCSAKGDIRYNWRIILAPHRIVDYVVVHELCHMLEHNHSGRYWKLVEKYVPDYRERRDWLKNHSLSL